MNGAELILNERRRQKKVEGYKAEHDDCHDGCELAQAAACYLYEGTKFEIGGEAPPWPWEGETYKVSTDLVRNLVKAGALIAAEIDRLQRAAKAEGRQ